MSLSRGSLSLLLSLCLLSAVHALICYENDEQGNTHERSSPDFKYCSLIPFGSDSGRGRLSGVSDTTENTSGFDATFAQSSAHYGVLAMCIFEKYDFSAISPVFGPAPEYMFRCFCSTDRCNRESTFSGFL
ncbi:hypothetical protein PMAYCL1PPCAC_29102, partial [Pristionchus mayeri]